VIGMGPSRDWLPVRRSFLTRCLAGSRRLSLTRQLLLFGQDEASEPVMRADLDLCAIGAPVSFRPTFPNEQGNERRTQDKNQQKHQILPAARRAAVNSGGSPRVAIKLSFTGKNCNPNATLFESDDKCHKRLLTKGMDLALANAFEPP